MQGSFEEETFMVNKQFEAIPATQADDMPATEAQTVEVTSARPDRKPVRSQAAGGLGAAMGSMGPLPLVLAIGALSRGGGGLGSVLGMGSQRRPRGARPALPAPRAQSEDAEAPAPSPRVQPNRPAMPPVDMKSLLGDIAGYLPGNSGMSATKVSKVLGMVDELRNVNNPAAYIASPTTANPMDRNIGLLSALGRNLPFAGAGNLTMIGQMMGMVNNFRGNAVQSQGASAGGPLGALGQLSNLGNMANMANMMRTAMAQTPQAPQPRPQPQEVKATVVPNPAADNLKDTVNRLLGGMDDRQKSELMARARQFLGQR